MYQVILSPLLGKRCRFYPSCSHYALDCFKNFSFFLAFKLASKRVLRCHPWANHGGYDPIPKRSGKE